MASILTILGFIVASLTVIDILKAPSSISLDWVYILTFSGIFLSILTFVYLALDYLAVTSEYDHEFGGDIREYKDEFNGEVWRGSEKFKASLETTRYIDVGHNRSFALWDEFISVNISSKELERFPFMLDRIRMM